MFATAISLSAWTTAMPRSRSCAARKWSSDDDGVIGYAKYASSPAAAAPSPIASLPETMGRTRPAALEAEPAADARGPPRRTSPRRTPMLFSTSRAYSRAMSSCIARAVQPERRGERRRAGHADAEVGAGVLRRLRRHRKTDASPADDLVGVVHDHAAVGEMLAVEVVAQRVERDDEVGAHEVARDGPYGRTHDGEVVAAPDEALVVVHLEDVPPHAARSGRPPSTRPS